MANEKDTLDRVHAINGAISGLSSSRYYPRDLSRAKLPLATCVPAQGQYKWYAHDQQEITRKYNLIVWVGSFESGLPTESAQRTAESIFPLIRAAYQTRKQLQNSDNGLTCTKYAELTGDSGIIQWPETTLAAIVFTLSVTTDEFV